MYLHEFCGSWMDHPFWRTGFVLQEAKDLDKIRATRIEEVWIDTAKGLDVAEGVAAVTPEEDEARLDTDFGTYLDAPLPQVEIVPRPRPAERKRPANMQEALREAASVCMRAKGAMIDMFSEARMGNAVDPVAAGALVEDITGAVSDSPHALIGLARLKTADDYTYMHSVAVCALMVALARQLKLKDDAVRLAGMVGLLHDLGKAMIPHDVLNKPGKLTDEEFTLIKSHPVHSHRMLQGSGVDAVVLDGCLHHHEKTDGTGYPHGLKHERISVVARMAAICDVYDAVTSNRPYKKGWDPAESLRRMADWTRGHLDQQLFHAFVKSIGIYPVGSFVRLASGRLGVVVEQSASALTSPRVKVFYSTKSDLRIPPEVIDLAAPHCQDKIIAREDPAHWNFPDLNELWTGIEGQPW